MKGILSLILSIVLISGLTYFDDYISETPFNWHSYFDLYSMCWGLGHHRIDIFIGIIFNFLFAVVTVGFALIIRLFLSTQE